MIWFFVWSLRCWVTSTRINCLSWSMPGNFTKYYYKPSFKACMPVWYVWNIFYINTWKKCHVFFSANCRNTNVSILPDCKNTVFNTPMVRKKIINFRYICRMLLSNVYINFGTDGICKWWRCVTMNVFYR